MQVFKDIVDILVKIALAIGGIGGGIWGLAQTYYLIKNKQTAQTITKRRINKLIISYVLSVFCISSLATLLVQYLYPPYGVWGKKEYIPILRNVPIYLQAILVLLVIILGIFSLKNLFKQLK